MSVSSVHCSYCGQAFIRSNQRVNEAEKFGWRSYCSAVCLAKVRSKQATLSCAHCSKTFQRRQSQLPKSKAYYCSRSCAASDNNAKYPKHPGMRKVCSTCKKMFISREKYCSIRCKWTGQMIPKEIILEKIQKFHKEHGRIPLKREFIHARASRNMFGTWNNAIIAAGLTPNPVRFAKKFLANDGHKCDSLAEKIIDDYLSERSIFHEIHVPYNKNNMTADFKVGDTLIEFFGLYGQLKSYDMLHTQKRKLWKERKLKVIELYPADLFPTSKLEKLLQFSSK